MDVEMVLPLAQRPIADGALGDDERTEAEKSPVEEGGKSIARAVPSSRLRSQDASEEHDDQDMDDEGDSPDGDPSGRGRKHRRGKQKGGRRHRNWKPYVKLSWEERQKLDERETRRAYKRREQRFASGHPVAPYNTTQFLMDQHPVDGSEEQPREREDMKLDHHGAMERDQGSASGLDSYSGSESYDSQDNEDIFMDKDFIETYENYHAERLRDMTKEDLIKELLDLETKVSRMEKGVRGGGGGQGDISPPKHNSNNNDTSISAKPRSDKPPERPLDPKCPVVRDPVTVQQMIKLLQDENERLRKENVELKKRKEERTTEG